MLKAPFPYFGGKSRIAHVIWAGLGDVVNYVEPFAGSLAVLLARPDWAFPEKATPAETVNDYDCLLANFWRALQSAPDAVADWCDWPINEADLHPRHAWLVARKAELREQVLDDPDYYDAKAAGWWVWGLSAWIGRGWCSVNHKQLPHLGDAGVGTQRELLTIIAERIRHVRVCCGDWSRVVTHGAMHYGKSVGVFLDPPYADTAKRHKNLYAEDSESVAHDVRRWAIEHGDDPRLRIVLAGYDGEHEMPGSWRVYAFSGPNGMAMVKTANRHKERLWFSPHCLHASSADDPKFALTA